jgi:hypothetical protein
MELQSQTGEKFETLSATDFGSFIEAREAAIIGSFLGLAKREVPAASNETLVRLKDHLPEMLRQVGRYLKTSGSEREMELAMQLAHGHARVRSENPEYTETQIRREFVILREVIFDLLGRRCFLEKDAARHFSDISEATLGETVATFVRARAGH